MTQLPLSLTLLLWQPPLQLTPPLLTVGTVVAETDVTAPVTSPTATVVSTNSVSVLQLTLQPWQRFLKPPQQLQG